MLKSQDILVLLKVHIKDVDWTYSQLARELGMSSSEVFYALERTGQAGLYEGQLREIRYHALLEFLIHGVKYVFATKPGPLVRGMPTAHTAEPLKSLLLVDNQDNYVWPDAQGMLIGQAIEPLHRTVPFAARQDVKLYQLLSLVDALRVGRIREQRFATHELEQRLQYD